MTGAIKELWVVYWEWPVGTSHAGSRHWAVHDGNDFRCLEWQRAHGLIPLAAKKVTLAEGEGAALIAEIRSRLSEGGIA